MNFYGVFLVGVFMLGGYSGARASNEESKELETICDSMYFNWVRPSENHEDEEVPALHRRASSFTEYDQDFDATRDVLLEEKTKRYVHALYEELQNPESRQRFIDGIDRCIERHPESVEELNAYKTRLMESASPEEFWNSYQALFVNCPELFTLQPVFHNGVVNRFDGIFGEFIPEEVVQEVNETIARQD